MKRQVMGLAAALACGAGMCGENLLKNGDFECGSAKGWGNWCPQAKMEVVKEGAHGGTYALRYVHADTKGQAITASPIDYGTNRTFTVRGWAKGAAQAIQVRAFYSDASGKYITEATLFSATTLADWTPFEKAFTVPEKAVKGSVGLRVCQGEATFDDIEVVVGNQVAEAPNLLLNTAFSFSLHDNGMPELWDTGGGYSFMSFRPGTHTGEFFRIERDMPSPVSGAKVLYVNEVGRTYLKAPAMAGETDYTFSVYAKAVKPGAKVKLVFGQDPKETAFEVGTEWTRLVHTTHLKSGVGAAYPVIDYGRNALYLAGLMLHEGKAALPWKPSPEDARIVDLRKGGQPKAVTGVRTLTVPSGKSLADGVGIDAFTELKDGGETVRGKYRVRVIRDGDVLKVAAECDSGAKPAVARKEHAPLRIGNDAVEVFLSSAVSGVPYLQFMGGRNGDFAGAAGNQGKAVNEGWKFRTKETEKGWACGFEIPLSLLPAPNGEEWRFNVGVTDFVGAKARYFSAVKEGFHATDKFIRVKGLPEGRPVRVPRLATEFDFYTTEKAARVKIEDVDLPATLTLVDKDGKTVRTDRVSEPGKAEVPLATLADGRCELRLAAANGTATCVFRKDVSAKPSARTDRFRGFIEVDGKPFFPTVFNWGVPELPTEWQIGELKSHNINTILLMPELSAPWMKNATPERRRAILLAFVRAGFKVFVWASANSFKTRGIDGLVDDRRGFISELGELKDRVLGWYYVDEIGAYWETHYGVKVEDYARGYRAMKDFDPERLHFINWGWTSSTPGEKFYAEDGATDLYSLDCYPYDDFGYGALDVFEKAARTIGIRVREGFLPGIMWLQTYAYVEGFREPMPVEYRNNVFMGLVHHVTGYMHFANYPEHRDLWDEMGRSYAAALKWLDMTAASGSRLLARGREGSVSYALWKDGRGGHALVAANTRYAPETLTLTSDEPLGGAVERIGGEGGLSVDGKSLKIVLSVAGSAVWFIK